MEFVPDPMCKYCKGTGMIELLISSKPCLDCQQKSKFLLDESDYTIRKMDDDSWSHNNI